jgi:hypothetical protein
MKLTKLQKKTLEFFHSCRSKPPTIGRQLGFNWFAWVPLLVVGVLGCLVLLTPGFEKVGWLWVGLIAGAFARDIGRFRGVVSVWPVYKEIINWQRVSDLLDSNENHDG